MTKHIKKIQSRKSNDHWISVETKMNPLLAPPPLSSTARAQRENSEKLAASLTAWGPPRELLTGIRMKPGYALE